MVEKLKNVQGVTQTGIDNLVAFSYANKTAIYDIEKREIVAEFKTRYNDDICIAFGKYLGVNSEPAVLIDLEKKEIIYKFNTPSIYKKYLLKKPNKYDSDNYGDYIWIVDITEQEILCRIEYYNSGERYSALCAFNLSTFEMLRYDYVDCYLGNYYKYNRREPQYSFLEYDENVINDALSLINLKKEGYFKVICYNKKYNVIFWEKGNHCYSYYIDGNGSADKIDTAENDFLAQLGNNEQKYIRENGLTAEVLKYLDPEVVLDGGYFWALDSINKKEKQFNMSFDDVVDSDKITEEELILYTIGLLETEIEEGIGQYFTVRDEKEIACLIKALRLIGATGTVKVIEKGIKFKKADKDMFDDEYEELVEKLDEDYVGLAIGYIKKVKGIA